MNSTIKSRNSKWSDAYGETPIEAVFRYKLLLEGVPESGSWELVSEDPLPNYDLDLSTIENPGVSSGHFTVCNHPRYYVSGSGGVSGFVDCVDHPVVVGTYRYVTNSTWVASHFVSSGAARSMRDVTSFFTSHLETWLIEHGQPIADKNFRYLKNPLDSGFSLPTFVRESKELVGLLKHILMYKKSLKKLGRAFKGKSLREIVRIVSDEHLTWAFGILPLISDIKSITEILMTSHEIINKLYSGEFRTHIYAKESVNLDQFNLGFTPSEESLGPYKGAGGPWFCTYGFSGIYKAYTRYNIRAGDIIRHPGGRFLALLDLLGVQFDPGIIYDAIPFSFVVDWFTDLGDNIHALEKPLVPVTMTVTEAAHHIGVELQRTWWYEEPISGQRIAMHSETIKNFLRRPYQPAQVPDKSHLKRLGFEKLLLAYSLLGSRRK